MYQFGRFQMIICWVLSSNHSSALQFSSHRKFETLKVIFNNSRRFPLLEFFPLFSATSELSYSPDATRSWWLDVRFARINWSSGNKMYCRIWVPTSFHPPLVPWFSSKFTPDVHALNLDYNKMVGFTGCLILLKKFKELDRDEIWKSM